MRAPFCTNILLVLTIIVFTSESPRADEPKDPLPSTILLVIPESFDKQVYDSDIGGERDALVWFVENANRLKKHEQSYTLIEHINLDGDREKGRAWNVLLALLSGQLGSALVWGEHLYSSDYLTIESWKAEGKGLCEEEAKNAIDKYVDPDPHIGGIVFPDGTRIQVPRYIGENETMKQRSNQLVYMPGYWRCTILIHKDWFSTVFSETFSDWRTRWFHHARCGSMFDNGENQDAVRIGCALGASVVTGFEGTSLDHRASEGALSEILAYMSGLYDDFVLPPHHAFEPSPNRNYDVNEAVFAINQETPGKYLLEAEILEDMDTVRLYRPPRVNLLKVQSRAPGGELEDFYRYEYSAAFPFDSPISGELDYPGYDDEGGRLKLSRLKTVETGQDIELEIFMTAKISKDEGGLSAKIYSEQHPQGHEFTVDLHPGQPSIQGEYWHSVAPVKIPDDFPDGFAVVELKGRGILPDNNNCLDTNGDGLSNFDNEPSCTDTNHKFKVESTKIIEQGRTLTPQRQKGISGPVSQGNPAALGDGVSNYFQFNREMDAETIPEVWVVSGMGMSYLLPLEDTLWVDGEDEDGKPIPSSRFEATWNIPEDFDASGQEFLRLDLEVRGAKTAGGREVKPQRKTKDDELLSLWADLVRPTPSVAGRIDPNVECGSLEINFAIDDEPSFYEPGSTIAPPSAKFERMDLHIEKDGLEILTEPLTDPNKHFVKSPPWASGDYRWWVEVEDTAGNLDRISFEQQGQERTAAQHFGVSSCAENSTFCNRLTCNANERRCDQDPVSCSSSDLCTSCHCDNIKEVCDCVDTCPPDPDDDDTYPPGYDRPDESHLFADDLPRWNDVTNEDRAARVGVVGASVYPSMFGLLDEFGEKARLVRLPLSPGDLGGVDLLIVPSGGLRNQQTEEFRQGVLAYVEGGGQLLVMAQPLGENFDVLPGEIEGYGWQQDRSCISRNIWIEEEYREHPALSAFGSSVIDIPLDGHFTVYPEGSQTLLRKVSNNRVALFSYAVGEGSVTVTSSYMDYWRALSWGRSAAGAVELGYGRSKTSGVMFFRDLISWLKMPAEIPRVIRDGGPVSLGLAVTNDAPGGEHAALAKLLVQEPNRNVITETVDLPVDLAEGESTQLSLDQEYDSNVHALRYGIWHVAVELYDGDGNLIREARDNPGGRFAVPYPIEGESYVPEDIVTTITTDKSVYLSYETAHFSYTVENQGDRERHLEISVGLVHVGSEITQDVILGPGEKWIEQRDYGMSDYREDGVFCMALDLDDDMRLAANAGLRIFFLAYPVVLSAATEIQSIVPGQSVPVRVSYHSLYESTIQGTLFLRAESLPTSLLEQELAVGPAGEGNLDVMLTIPADSEPGQLTLMGWYEDEEGHVLGSFSTNVVAYSPFLEMHATIEPDRESYHRGDTILSTISFANDSREALDIHYQLRLGDIESPPESVSIAAEGEVTRQAQLEVPWNYPFTKTKSLVLAYWETAGNELYKIKNVRIFVPILSSVIETLTATPSGVDVSSNLSTDDLMPLEVDAGCRLYSPGGGLVAEDAQTGFIIDPSQSNLLTCHLPLNVLERGEYTLDVFAESAYGENSENFEKIRADLAIEPAISGFMISGLAWEKSYGEPAGPVALVNRGDFTYPAVLVSESLPEVGLAWSREVAVGPRQVLIVTAPEGVTIPFFRNAASHYRCIGTEIMTEIEDDMAAEIAGGFGDSRVETVRIETPRLGVDIENVDLDLCRADALYFDVIGHGTVYGLGGPEEMIVKVSVPGAGFEQDVSRTISPGSPSWSEHFAITLPSGIENASDEIRVEIVKPDVNSYPTFIGELSTYATHFVIEPALLSARLSSAPSEPGGSGEVTIDSGGMLGTDHGWELSLTGFGGVEYLADAGGGYVDGCGAQVRVPFTLPSDLASGRYRLHFELRKGTEDAVPYTFPIDISGLAAGLDLWTDRDVYRLSDPVSGLGTLTNGPVPVTGGDLHLEVVRLRAGAAVPPWPALGASVSRRFASSGAGEIEAPRLLWEQAPSSMTDHWAADRGPALADLDGDGAADVVLVSGDGVIRAYRGRDGVLLWSRSFTPSDYSTVPQVADIDDDSSGEVFVQLPDSVLCLSGETGQVLWEAPLGEQHQVGAASPLGVADLDGDGVPEVFHLDFESGTAFLHARDARDGTSLWDTRSSGLPFAVFGDQSLSAGDLDGDGAAEVLVTGGFVGGLAAVGDGGSVVWAGLPECSSTLPVVADLDGDGPAEVITTCSSNFGAYPPEVVALSGSDGGILWRTSITAGGGASTMPMSPLTVADLNGDGLLEIAGYFGSPFGGDIVVLDAGGNETWRLDYGSVSGGMPACDLDGDGRMELLVLDEASVPWSLRLLDGATGAQVWDAGESGLELWGRANPAVADLDGDGWLEIALVDSADWSGASGRFLAIDSDVTGGPRPGGEITEEILWQTDRAQDLGASESVGLSEDIGLLGVTGQLWFRGWLTSALGQELARDRYPFLIVDGDQALSLATDAEVYKTGDTVSVSGLVSELSGLPASDLVVTVRGAGGVIFQEAFDLSAYEQHAYTFTQTAGVPGTYDLSAELTLAGGSVASALARYRVAPVQVAVSFDAPDVVDVEPFDMVARIENNGELAADLDLTLSEPGSQEVRSVSLQAGEISEQVFTRSILEDTAYHLETSGDLTWSDDRLVRFGPASQIAVTPFAGYSADEPIDIPWTLSNIGLFARDYGMSLEILDASDQVIDTTGGSYMLALPGDVNNQDKAYGLWSPVLPPGDYSLRYSAEFGNSGITPVTVGLPVAAAGVSPEPSYRTGLVEVPWSVTNVSPFDAEFALDLSIRRDGQVVAGWSLQVYLDSAGGIADSLDDAMAAFLEPGAYQARVDGERISEPAVAGFAVLPDRDVLFAAAPGVAACGLQPFDLTVTNAGFEDFSGFVTAESDFWHGQVNVTAAGRGGTWSATLQANLAAAEPGMRPFTLKLHDSAGEVLSEVDRTVAVQGGVCALASAPPQTSFAAGGEASFPFVVSNGGDQTAHCRLTLDAFEEQGPEQANLTIEPCAEAPVSFGYLLPWDLEGGPQTLGYSLEPRSPTTQGTERGFTTFHVDGVELLVTATLDKCFYRPQETAQLDLLIESTGTIVDVPLIASLSYPGSEYEVPFELSAQPQTLHFEIPLGDIPADRILYTIGFTSGRSIYIDAKRVYGGGVTGPEWLCSDKDVYDAGDTVELTFGSDEDCDFKIRLLEFGFEHQENVVAGTTSQTSLVLPTDIRQGTHVIEYGCGTLSWTHPIEVRGYSVRIVWLVANDTFYLPDDPLSVEALVESGPAFSGPFHCVVTRPDGTRFDLPVSQHDFSPGYNFVDSTGTMDTGQAGRHRITCTIYKDAAETIFLAGDSTHVQVGDFQLLGVTTDRDVYESGYDAATGIIRMWGYVPEADLQLSLDGAGVHSETLALDGFATVSVPISVEQIKALGDHQLSGSLSAEQLTSMAGKSFTTRDTIPPVIDITGVEEGGMYALAVTPIVTVSDMNPGTHDITLDGATWASGVTISLDGLHVLEVEAVDLAGNRSEASVSFRIDRSAPVITLTGVANGECYPTEVSPAWTVSDDNIESVTATLDGLPVTSGTPVGEGEHSLIISAVDLAGNVAEINANFTVDLTDPIVTIGGVIDGLVTEQDVFPVVDIQDDNLVSGRAYLDGEDFQAGSVVGAEGNHVIEGWAFDCAGRQAFASARFSIDRSPPEIDLYFVEDGGCYKPPVWPTYGAYDDNLTDVTALLDGQPFENGSQLDAAGAHKLVVQAIDAAGHQAQISATFILDDTPPVLSVSGVADEAFYNHDVAATIGANDDNFFEIYALLDGADYVSGTAIGEQGEHDLLVVATDCAGNQAAFTAAFVIDKTPPLIAVTGVADGETYSGAVTPVIEVSDDYLDEVSITLDGTNFTSGTEVSADGGHLLLVQATDLAGNESMQSVAFDISMGTRPPFHFGVCTFGNVTMLNHAAIMGFDTATGQITDGGDVAAHGGVSLVNNSRLSGEVVAGGDVSLSHNADIYGDVYLAGSVSLAHNSAIHGTVFELETAPAPCECGYDLDQVLEYRSTHNDNSVIEADPDIAPYLEDGSLHVAHNKHVILPDGIFYFDSITLENHAGLSLASGAVVELYIAHELIVANNADLSNDPYRAGDLLIVLGTDSAAGEQLKIRNNTDFGIMLYAPRADLVYSNNADLYGGLVVRDLTAENHGQIMVYDGLSTSPPPLVCE